MGVPSCLREGGGHVWDRRKTDCSGSILTVQGERTNCLHLKETIAVRSAGDNSGRTGFWNSSSYKQTAHGLYLVKDKLCLAHY